MASASTERAGSAPGHHKHLRGHGERNVVAPLLFRLAYLAVVSFLVSCLFVRLSIGVAFRVGLLDHPVGGRTHEEPTPLLGGVAMFLTLVVVIGGHLALVTWPPDALADLVKDYTIPLRAESSQRLLAIAIATGAIVLIGFLDDWLRIGVGVRMILELGGATVLAFLGIMPTLAHIHPVLIFLFTVLWLVGITNAFNLLDGLDGLAGGVAAVACALFLIFMVQTGQGAVAMLLACLLGAVLGFLVFNWNPARTYMGSAGSLMLGFLLASVPMVSDFMQEGESSLAPLLMPILILGVPIYDTLGVMVIRAHNGRNPLRSDHNHLAHRLRRLGMTVKQTVGAICLLGLATGSASLLLVKASDGEAVMIIVSVAAIFAVFVLLERVHLAHKDSFRFLDVPAQCLIDDPDVREQADLLASHGHVRMLSPDRIEFSADAIAGEHLQRALREHLPIHLQMQPRNRGAEGLTLRCHLTHVWTEDQERHLMALTPLYDADLEREHARHWIQRLIYPARET